MNISSLWIVQLLFYFHIISQLYCLCCIVSFYWSMASNSMVMIGILMLKKTFLTCTKILMQWWVYDFSICWFKNLFAFVDGGGEAQWKSGDFCPIDDRLRPWVVCQMEPRSALRVRKAISVDNCQTAWLQSCQSRYGPLRCFHVLIRTSAIKSFISIFSSGGKFLFRATYAI